jgi:hypothetical protein
MISPPVSVTRIAVVAREDLFVSLVGVLSHEDTPRSMGDLREISVVSVQSAPSPRSLEANSAFVEAVLKSHPSAVQALELDDSAVDARFATNAVRVENREALCEILTPALRKHGADHWFSQLTGLGVPAGPINDVAEAFAFALGLAATVTVPGTTTPQVANPISMSATPPTYRSALPCLGQDDPH